MVKLMYYNLLKKNIKLNYCNTKIHNYLKG